MRLRPQLRLLPGPRFRQLQLSQGHLHHLRRPFLAIPPRWWLQRRQRWRWCRWPTH